MKAPKITFIGAGSTVFVRHIVGDLLFLPAFRNAHISLHDINASRLAESETILKRIAEQLGAAPTITATTNRKEALCNADFVLTMFQVGGYKPATVIDFDIPKKYGLNQTIGDTLGVGGIMRAARSIPVFLEIAKDMEDVCPHALLLNYVNPMAMISWAMSEFAPNIKYVGLCHSVQGGVEELARDLGIEPDEIEYFAAGINHMAYYLRLEHKHSDGTKTSLYPTLKEKFAKGELPVPNHHNPRCLNKIRFAMMEKLGYYVTESSEHFSEYTPYFIKNGREDLLERYHVPLNEYPIRCEEQIASWQKELASEEEKEIKQSHEYAAVILNAIRTNTPAVINGNVPNAQLIENLPQGCAVEVPCLVNSNGIQPVKAGRLPEHLAALMRSNVNVQALVVEAFRKQDSRYFYYAALTDPHTAAELDIDQIENLVNELLAEHKKQGYMPDFV